VVGVGIGVRLAWNCGDNGIVMCKTGHLQICCTTEVAVWPDGGATTIRCAAWSQILCQIVFGDHLQRLLKDLPQLDRLVVRGQQVVRSILTFAPFDLVNLLFDFQ